jgi:hypothetical protein
LNLGRPPVRFVLILSVTPALAHALSCVFMLQHSAVRPFLVRWWLAALVASFPGAAAFAAETIDQSHFFAPGPYIGGAWAGQSAAQTFTVGMTGRLTALDLLLDDASEELNTDLFRIELRPVVDGLPSSDPSSARTFADFAALSMPYLGPAWRRYDLPPAEVVAGEQLAIVITPTGRARAIWAGDIPGYAAGAPFIGGTTGFTSIGFYPFGTGVGDYGFQTYVETAVPEPGLALVAAVAFGAWRGGRGRRRSRR